MLHAEIPAGARHAAHLLLTLLPLPSLPAGGHAVPGQGAAAARGHVARLV